MLARQIGAECLVVDLVRTEETEVDAGRDALRRHRCAGHGIGEVVDRRSTGLERVVERRAGNGTRRIRPVDQRRTYDRRVHFAVAHRERRRVALVAGHRIAHPTVLGQVHDAGRVGAAHPTTIAALVTARVEFEVVRGRPAQRQRIVLVAVVVGVLVTGLVVDVAVAGALRADYACRQNVLDQRPGKHAVLFDQIVVSTHHARDALELVRRQPVDEVDGTADGVTAVQRALRASQHLDPLDVEQTAFGRCDTEVFRVHAVQIGGDARIAAQCAEVPADTADRHVIRLDHRGRNVLLQVFLVADTEVFEHLTGERSDRNGRVADRGLFPFRGDDHFLDLASVRCTGVVASAAETDCAMKAADINAGSPNALALDQRRSQAGRSRRSARARPMKSASAQLPTRP